MKCEICNFQESPENLQKLATHTETSGNPLCRTGTVVWRDGQSVLTLSPKENEHVFQVEFRDVPPPPEPPIFVPTFYEPDVSVMALETTSNRKRPKDRHQHDD